MREKFMTTLTKEAKEKLGIISAKERKCMNTILEELILGYYEPIEFKNLMDYLNFKKIYKYNTERFIDEIYVTEENTEEYKKFLKIG